MYYPGKEEFVRLAKKGNLIPVYREIMADLDTPISAFTKIDTGEYSFLLESVEGGERLARYSFLGSRPALVFSAKGNAIELCEEGSIRKYSAKTLTEPMPEEIQQ
jgi:anthranilate synthase component 1